MESRIDIDKAYRHWVDTSDKDYDTMIHLFQSRITTGLCL